MSTDTSAPQPQMSGLDISDSALLDTLLREAPIGFAFFGPDLRFRRINRALASLPGRGLGDHLGRTPSQVWPELLASRREWLKTAKYCPGMGKGPLIQIAAAREQAGADDE